MSGEEDGVARYRHNGYIWKCFQIWEHGLLVEVTMAISGNMMARTGNLRIVEMFPDMVKAPNC